MSTARPIHEVYRQRAERVGVVLSSRIAHFRGFRPGEPLNAYVHDTDGGGKLVQFQRVSDLSCYIEFGNVFPGGIAEPVYGPETILKAEDLGAVSASYDNTTGFKPIDLSFRDLFAKTDTRETDASGGTSTKVTLEAEENIEGFASIKESIETEVHAEFAEREGSEVTNEREGEEATIVPVGKIAKVTLTRKRADTELEVTSDAQFTSNLTAGKHGHGWNHGWRGHRRHRDYQRWDSWSDFEDVIRGDSPNNIDLATSFQRHPGPRYYQDVLDPLNGKVRYKVRFEGKIIRSYTVRGYNADGTPFHPLDADGR